MIAVIGSAQAERAQELRIKAIELARSAGVELGRALAKKGCDIVVYDGHEGFLEVDVVRGYAEVQEAPRDSIQVRYSKEREQPSFEQEAARAELFWFRPDTSADWKRSFYLSLSEVDGIILLGGGQSTLIAGLVATGNRKAIVTCGYFGGAAHQIWGTLSPSERLKQEEIYLMAQPWKSGLADKLVEVLVAQIARAEDERRAIESAVEARIAQARTEERKSLAGVRTHAITGALTFIGALATWVFSRFPNLEAWTYMSLLLGSALLAGIAGAMVRVLMEAFGTGARNQQPFILTAVAGLISGGISGVLFTIAPLLATGTSANITDAQIRTLVPFVMSIGFIGGLTLDAVFKRLRDVNVQSRKALQNLTE